MSEELKQSRIVIRHLEGDCMVQLFDKDNEVVLEKAIIDGSDPYLFISRLRESIDGALISEEPRLEGSEQRSFTHPFIQVIADQIEELKKMKHQMLTYFEAQEEAETPSFTDNLT